MNATPVKFNREITHEVIQKHLAKACDNLASMIDYLTNEIMNGGATLWKVTDGWMVLGVTEFSNKRYLFVHALQGRALLNENAMDLLYQISTLEGCVGVMCESKKIGVMRILSRYGFRHHNEIFNVCRYEQSGLVPLIKDFY